MLGLFGLLGLMMAGVVGGSIALRPDSLAEDEGESAAGGDEAEGRTPTADPAETGSGQMWDAGLEGGTSAGSVTAPVSDAAGAGRTGSAGGDGLEGTEGDDTLAGLGGDDQIEGDQGDDLLMGGDGNDTLNGGFGQDTLTGGNGADYLAGHEGDDVLGGGRGDDTLLGGNGGDSLAGGAGDDWLAGGMGDDLMVAGAGQDTLDGDAGNDTLVGAFFGDPDDWGNCLNGGDGDDVLRIGAGDIATGADGSDRFEVSSDVPPGAAARIMDFDSDQDELVVVYDGAGPAPVVSLAPGGLPDEVAVLLDGQPIAFVVGGATTLTPGAIRLVAG